MTRARAVICLSIILFSSTVLYSQERELSILNINDCPIKIDSLSAYSANFTNISDKSIGAVRFKVVYLNVFDEFVGIEFYTFLEVQSGAEIAAGKGNSFTWKPKFIGLAEAFHFFVYVDKCAFKNKDIWTQPDEKLLGAIAKIKNIPISELKKFKPRYDNYAK